MMMQYDERTPDHVKYPKRYAMCDGGFVYKNDPIGDVMKEASEFMDKLPPSQQPIVTRASQGDDAKQYLQDWHSRGYTGNYVPEALRSELEGEISKLKEERELPHPTVGPRSKLLWIGVDLDGTLSEPIWTPENPTSEIGKPIWENVRKLREAVDAGYKPVIHTSRPWNDFENIETWLNFYEIPFKGIYCGKPLYRAYVDDRAIHSEEASWIPTDQQTP